MTARPRVARVAPGWATVPEGARALSARSVIASTLLGVEPPRLPSRLLVRSGELFGIAEGTTRVALSRMVAAGELEADDGDYRLAGTLLERHARQRSSRRAEQQPWSGEWVIAVVGPEPRPAPSRVALREAARQLKLAERREGVWLRPDNLDPERAADARRIVEDQCTRFIGRPEDELGVTVGAPAGGRTRRSSPGRAPARAAGEAAALAEQLWDLGGWARSAERLRVGLDGLVGELESGETGVLAEAFVLSAGVLRHLLADPLLPAELLPAGWPGPPLRTDYDRYDAAFNALWRQWFRSQ